MSEGLFAAIRTSASGLRGQRTKMDVVARNLANAETTRKVLSGKKGPCRDIVCLNAAAAIVAGGKADDLKQGWKLAQESIDSGKAQKALEELVRVTKE